LKFLSKKTLLFIFKKVFLVVGICLFAVSLIVTLTFNVFLAPSIETHFQIEVNQPFGIWGENGTVIDAVIYQPRGVPFTQVVYAKRPVVILVHGFSCDKTYMKGAAYELNKRGFVTISISARGHGASMGQFAGGVYFYNETLAMVQWIRENAGRFNIDVDRIGLVGHSMGAVTVTNAATMDQELGNFWINSTVAIAGPVLNYTRGDPGVPGTGEGQSEFSAPHLIGFYLPQLALTRNVQSNMLESIIEGRVNDTKPYNYLNIIGSMDQAFTVASAKEVVYAMGEQPVFGVTDFTALPEGTVYGNFQDGTARKLSVVPGIDHLLEMHDPEVLVEMIDWFEESMMLTTEAGYPGQVNVFNITEPIRFSANIFCILAILILFIPLTVYLGNALKPLMAPSPKAAHDIPEKDTKKLFLIYGAIFAGTAIPVLPIILTFNLQFIIATDFLLSNIFVLFGFIHSMILLPALIILMIFENRKYSEKLSDFGLAKESIPSSILYGITIVGIYFIMGNLIATNNYHNMMPYKIWGFLEIFGYLFVFFLISELFLRGLIQTKLSRYKGKKIWKFPGKELILTSLITGTIQGTGLGIIFGMFNFYASGSIVTAILIPFACILLFVPIAAIQAWFYRKCRNVFASIMVSSLFLAWIFSIIMPAIDSVMVFNIIT